MKTMNFVLGVAVAVAAIGTGCASSMKNFDPKDVADDEGVILGKVNVTVDGQDLTKHCYVGFNGDHKPYVSLDETGTVIAKAKKGDTSLSYISCADYGMITVTHTCDWKGATFQNVGDGKQTYFGNVKVEWNPTDTGGRKVASAMFGAIGAAAAGQGNQCSTQKVTITNDLGEAKKVYSRFGAPNVETKMMGKPTGE